MENYSTQKYPPVADQMTKEQLMLYNANRKEYLSILETLYRFHQAPRKRIRAVHNWYMPQRPLTFEEKLPDVLKDWFRIHQLQARKEFFQKLDPAGIPNDSNLIELMEWEDDRPSTLGDKIWYYESPVLDAFIPVNMSHRYRGMPPTCNALKAIKILNLLEKEEESLVKAAKNQEVMNKKNPYEELEKAAVSSHHFQFLKEISEAQLVTIPFSILAIAMEDVFPYYEDLFHYYCYHFRETNKKSMDVLTTRGKLNDKIQLYNHM